MRPDADEGEKRTNEIGTVLPLLETLPDIAGRTVTADALLTQRTLAKYLLGRGAALPVHRQGQPADPARRYPPHSRPETSPARAGLQDDTPKPEHGRRERRSIWVSSTQRLPRLPRRRTGLRRAPRNRRGQVRQAPLRDRLRRHQPDPAGRTPQRLLTLNRGHWTIEATHHILDWSFDEDRSRIRSGHGPENMTRLRRFAIGLISPPSARAGYGRSCPHDPDSGSRAPAGPL